MGSIPTKRSSVFIDSSVLISASLSRTGYARDLVLLGIDGSIQLVASPFVLEETRRNLARKSPVAVPIFDMFLELDAILLADPPVSLVDDIAHLVEAKDAAIVAGAIAASCSRIATFDRRHLLVEAERILDTWGVSVATPSEIVQLLVPQPDE